MPRIISPDDYRYQGGEYVFRRSLEPRVWGSAYWDLMSLMNHCTDDLLIMVGIPGSGKTTWAIENGHGYIVFDATNLTPERRAPVIAMAHALDVTVRAVFLDTHIEVCKARNSARDENRRVPDNAMFRMSKTLVPPDMSEGFAGMEVFREERRD